jgi:hypothetical protein
MTYSESNVQPLGKKNQVSTKINVSLRKYGKIISRNFFYPLNRQFVNKGWKRPAPGCTFEIDGFAPGVLITDIFLLEGVMGIVHKLLS